MRSDDALAVRRVYWQQKSISLCVIHIREPKPDVWHSRDVLLFFDMRMLCYANNALLYDCMKQSKKNNNNRCWNAWHAFLSAKKITKWAFTCAAATTAAAAVVHPHTQLIESVEYLPFGLDFFPYVGHPSSSTPTKERLLVCVGVAQLSAEGSCCCWSLSPKWTQSHCARILTRRELSSIRIFVKLVECFTYSGVHLAVTIKYSGSVNECYTAVFIVIHSELSFIRVDLWS